MLKSEQFVTISLDTDECDICHQCTGEALVTCKECFYPVTEEPVREGFNRLLGVVHQNVFGHEVCFKKAHQVLSQKIGNRKLSSDSVTSQLKGLLDEKMQQIIKYARNEGNLSAPQPLFEVKSTPCSRTSSPLRGLSKTRFEQAIKRKCSSDENIHVAQRESRRPALGKVPTIYVNKQSEMITPEPRIKIQQEKKLLKHEATDQNDHIHESDFKTKRLDSHDSKSGKKTCDRRECRDASEKSESSGGTIKIPSDKYVYLPCEHQYASEGWTIDDILCDICEHHHHQLNQSEQVLTSTSQSESSTDNDVEEDSNLLPVAKSAVAKGSNKDNKVSAYSKNNFKSYSSEELKVWSRDELSKMLEKLKSNCKDISSKLVMLLQERDDLKQEVRVRHLTIEKLVSIQATE